MQGGWIPARLGLVVLATLLLLVPGVQAAPADGPPNIVFIMADDLGYGDLGCYESDKIHTPCLDRMAGEGMRFTQFYAGAPVCAPSRCVLLTGKHLGHAYIRDNREVKPEGQEPIPDSERTLAEMLHAGGYATAAVGKWGLGPHGSSGDPNRQGFDLFFGYNCQRHAHNYYPTYLWRNAERITLEGNDGTQVGKQYAHDLLTEEALQFVRDRRDRPFFLYLPYTIPHVALQVPDDSLAEYRGIWPDPPYVGGKGYFPHPTPRAAYAAMITRMDRDIGRLLALLAELGLDERTIVFFTSDNGPTHGGVGGSDSEFFQSAGTLRGLKGTVFEGGIRVPLIARWPGRIAPGTVSDHVAAFYDVFPTLADLSGIEAPQGLDGLSFAPALLQKGNQPEHAFLLWEFHGYGGQQAVRMGNWKAIRQKLHKSASSPVELYDLASDPSEQHDVAGEHPEIVARAEEILRREHADSPLWQFGGQAKP